MSANFVYSNSQERNWHRHNVYVALSELKQLLPLSNRVVCKLSASGLTLDCASVLLAELKPLERVYALDLSLNHIRATWQELLPVVKTVRHLDLSINYLPALQTLQEDFDLLNAYKSLGKKLSLDLDGNPLTEIRK